MDAVILAGGKGSRMEDALPKPLVSAQGRPILSRQVSYLLRFNEVNKLIFSLGHRAGEIMEYAASNYPMEKIDFSVEHEPLGTGGAIKKALSISGADYVLVLNCDDIVDIDVSKLAMRRENTICVAHPQLPFGRVRETVDGYASFEEKPVLDDWVSCGWYLFDRKSMLAVLPDNGSIEYDVFPKVKLRMYKHDGFWKPLNLKKDIAEFEKMELPDVLRI